MPTIAVNPLVLKDVILTLNSNDYQAHVSGVVFTPASSIVTWKGLTPTSVHSAGTTATWTADLTYVQDWETPSSLSQILFANEGSEQPCSFKPRSGSGPTFTATLIIAPGAIGGAVDTYGETTSSLGCKGKPVLVPAATVIPTVTGADKSTGGIAGGTLVEVTGTGFTGATAVHFLTTAATQFTVESDTTLFVVAPAAAAGSKPIKVTNTVGQSTTSAAFTYA